MLKPWKKQPNVEKMGNFEGVMNKLAEAMQQQSKILAQGNRANPTAPLMLPTPTKAVPGALSEHQMAKLLACAGLEWTEQDKLPTIWGDFLSEPNKTAKSSFLQT